MQPTALGVVALAPALGLGHVALPALNQLLLNLRQLHQPAQQYRSHLSPRLTYTRALASPSHQPLFTIALTSPLASCAGRPFTTTPSSLSSSSSSSSASGSGSRELLASKCRVLPFSLTRDEADQEWARHHKGLFTSQPGGSAAVKPTLLPFWCFSAEAQIHVKSAQIGRDYLVSRYNPATRRMQPQWETHWTTVFPDWRYVRRWRAESPEMQVYGGSKYRHDPALDRMKPGEHIRRALPYNEYVSTQDAKARRAGAEAEAVPERMVPFRLGPTEAMEAVQRGVRAAELRAAEQQLLSTFGGDRVRLVVMEAGLAGLTATPIFVPVFVFKARIRGTAMRTYVAGFSGGHTAGPLLPNPTRVGTAVAAASLVAGGFMGAVTSAPALVLGVAVPWMIGYAVASFWPELHSTFLRARARLLRPLPDVAEADEERWWRYEWVRQDPDEGYSYSEEGRYSHSYSYGRQQARQESTAGGSRAGYGYGGGYGGGAASASAPSSDPKGYYRTLGVSPGCSTEEIQAAFRAAALKWHPDRQPDPAKKAESTKRFQTAQEAYSVLRDPGRRAAYDRGR